MSYAVNKHLYLPLYYYLFFPVSLIFLYGSFFFCQKNTFGISFNVSVLVFCSLRMSEHRRSTFCLPSQGIFPLSIGFYVGTHFLPVTEIYCYFVFGFSLFLWVIICKLCCFPFEGNFSLLFSTWNFFLWRGREGFEVRQLYYDVPRYGFLCINPSWLSLSPIICGLIPFINWEKLSAIISSKYFLPLCYSPFLLALKLSCLIFAHSLYL